MVLYVPWSFNFSPSVTRYRHTYISRIYRRVTNPDGTQTDYMSLLKEQ